MGDEAVVVAVAAAAAAAAAFASPPPPRFRARRLARRHAALRRRAPHPARAAPLSSSPPGRPCRQSPSPSPRRRRLRAPARAASRAARTGMKWVRALSARIPPASSTAAYWSAWPVRPRSQTASGSPRTACSAQARAARREIGWSPAAS